MFRARKTGDGHAILAWRLVTPNHREQSCGDHVVARALHGTRHVSSGCHGNRAHSLTLLLLLLLLCDAGASVWTGCIRAIRRCCTSTWSPPICWSTTTGASRYVASSPPPTHTHLSLSRRVCRWLISAYPCWWSAAAAHKTLVVCAARCRTCRPNVCYNSRTTRVSTSTLYVVLLVVACSTDHTQLFTHSLQWLFGKCWLATLLSAI